MLDEFIKCINELIGYKEKYEHAMHDQQTMANAIYDLHLEKYNNRSFKERKEYYINDMCKCCRYYFDCDKEKIPENILMPIKNDIAWFPKKISCKDFKWS